MSPSASPRLFHLAPDALSFAGASDRFAKNLAALQLVHDLEVAGRPASDAERLALAHYSAFGESALLNRLFRYEHGAGRYVLYDSYAAFLSAADARRLRQAALTAFYTPLDLIHTIWQAVLRLGLGDGSTELAEVLERPRIIEPAARVGHFVSAMPPELRARAAITAVELDPVTSRILHHIHPDLTLHGGVGFEAVELPSNGFDLAISNVPFGELRVIAAAFAAAEEQAGSPEPTAAPAPEESDLATTLLALAQADRADDDGGWAPVIPPAPASLAWMAAQEAPVEPSACPTPLPARPAAARRPVVPMPALGETFQQLSLFG